MDKEMGEQMQEGIARVEFGVQKGGREWLLSTSAEL